MKYPSIAFVGPIAVPGKPAKGGYESANRRTIDLLRLHGTEVWEMPYPDACGPTWRKTLTYLLGYLRIGFSMVVNFRKFKVMHITPLRRQFIVPEIALCVLVRKLKKKIVMDIRAGTFVNNYYGAGKFYRFCVRRLLQTANVIAVEGSEYVPFVKSLTKIPVWYFPNYILWDETVAKKRTRQWQKGSPIQLVYLGRVVPEKGIEIAISTRKILEEKGIPATLTIIGNGDPAYVSRWKKNTEGQPVLWTGPLKPDKILDVLKSMDIFLFPTTHEGEGHSNALTEAMAMGVVPVCSDNGFNASVIGGGGKILPQTATANDYANAVKTLLSGKDTLAKLSNASRDRIKSRFSETATIPELLAAYSKLA